MKSIHSRCNAGDGSDVQAVWEILAKVCITAGNVGTQAINKPSMVDVKCTSTHPPNSIIELLSRTGNKVVLMRLKNFKSKL